MTNEAGGEIPSYNWKTIPEHHPRPGVVQVGGGGGVRGARTRLVARQRACWMAQ